MNIAYLLATPSEIAALATIKHATWPDEDPLDPAIVATALQTPGHQTHIVAINGRSAGFASSFLTQSATGERRWEIDLLAVHPDFRGLGLGSKLVETAVNAAPAVAFARALIHVDNVPSQRSFARHGFQPSSSPVILHICSHPTPNTLPLPTTAHLVPVNTLTYRGLWLEGELSPAAFRSAQTECLRQQRDLIGALIPADDQPNQQAAQACRFVAVGVYQVWISNEPRTTHHVQN
ncbi:MAG: GNAT family N-acetyltransferase [Anaerolineales bacterium]|nr:GNAT family N-acetyltransferase [Anaerolineales bacterium]